MTCRELAELLMDFIAGELAPEQADGLQKHLGDCPPCVAFVETYRATVVLARQLPSRPLPAHLETRLRDIVARASAVPAPEGHAS